MPPATTEVPENSDLLRAAAAGIVAALIVATLYLGRPVLVPFALAVLLAFALARPVEFLRRIGLPRTVSVVLTVLTAVVMIGAVGTFIGMQLGSLVEELPRYQANLNHKVESVHNVATGNSVVESITSLFENLSNAVAQKSKASAQHHAATAVIGQKTQTPIPVELYQPALAPLEIFENVVVPLLEPLATLAIAIVFVVFILLQKEDLRNRFISLAGSHDIQRTSRLLDDGAERLSSYLLLQTVVNTCVGTAIALGLWLLGVPNPLLWGLIAGVFRFVPYVGMPAAALIPLALSLAVDPGWSLVIFTAILYVLTEAVAGQGVEPWLYGRNMGLSPIAILLAAAFWTWVWGPLGLLLSTPLTMCVVVLGRHVEHLRFLDTLLGDRPTLGADEEFYLRVIKDSPDDLTEQAELFLKDKPLEVFFDEVALKGLALAQADINRGATLGHDVRERIFQTIEGLVANLAEEANDGAGENATPVNQLWARDAVLCVAGRSALDQAAALLLKDLLRRQGIGTRIVSADDASNANIHRLEPGETRVICLSYLEPSHSTNARYLVRRLRKQLPNVTIIAGFWTVAQSDTDVLDWIESTGTDFAVAHLQGAVARILALARKDT